MDSENVRNLIICVCTANICRSPIAEKLLEHALKKEKGKLTHLQVVSPGISAMDGEAPSTYSVQVLKKVGIDLSAHKSQRVTEALVKRAFAIFCMTSTHKLLLEHQYGEYLPQHVFLMRELVDATQSTDIPDPYGGSVGEYESCRDSLVEAIPAIVEFLKKEYNP